MSTMLPPIAEVPAAHLAGRTLKNGWYVKELVDRDPSATGGHFSVSYRVVAANGTEAFMKALNFHAALTGPGPLVDRLSDFLQAFQFERDLMRQCSSSRMTRVIQLLDDGEVNVPAAGVLSQVPYLIFEMADGDIRAHQARLARFDAAWALRVLMHASIGIEQLHASLAAHQDLKPSNVLTQAKGTEMKLGDLGRADRRGVETAWSNNQIPGAVGYAPPEQLYGAFGRSWEDRKGADLYLLGSLATQLFLGHNLTALLQAKLPLAFRALRWHGDFPSVLAALRAAHAQVMEELRAAAVKLIGNAKYADEFVEAVSLMTDPDPSLRGHPRDRAAKTSSFAIRRFVSIFSRLSRAVELSIRGSASSVPASGR